MMQILFLLSIFFSLVKYQHCQKECSEILNQKSALLFTDDQIDSYCKKASKWSQASREADWAPIIPTEAQITSNQKAWLYPLRECRGEECLSLIGPNAKPAIRKEYRSLSKDDRAAFHWAFQQLKIEKIDGVSKFQLLTRLISAAESPGAYFGPAFLPWNREWLKQLVLIF